MPVHFCPHCGRLNLEDFLYCPYCGEAVPRGPGLEESLEGPFERITLSVQDGLRSDFAALEERLAALESDMDAFISAAGSGGRPRSCSSGSPDHEDERQP